MTLHARGEASALEASAEPVMEASRVVTTLGDGTSCRWRLC